MSISHQLTIVFVFVTVFYGNAFKIINPKVALALKRSHKMAIITPDVPGQVAPTGFFDPLGFSVGTDERIFKRWQESELKHGRLSMVAVIGMLTAEVYHPMFDGVIDVPAISHFKIVQFLWPNFWLIPFFATGFFEFIGISKGWAQREETSGTAAWLKVDYVPGDLGLSKFDFLGLREEFNENRTKELQNGRLAMLACAGIVAQELRDGLSVWDHITQVGLFSRC